MPCKIILHIISSFISHFSTCYVLSYTNKLFHHLPYFTTSGLGQIVYLTRRVASQSIMRILFTYLPFLWRKTSICEFCRTALCMSKLKHSIITLEYHCVVMYYAIYECDECQLSCTCFQRPTEDNVTTPHSLGKYWLKILSCVQQFYQHASGMLSNV